MLTLTCLFVGYISGMSISVCVVGDTGMQAVLCVRTAGRVGGRYAGYTGLRLAARVDTK